jgi:adenosine kinase
MLRHTDECRDRGYPFAADPSQQMALMGGEDIKALVDGATYLFTNDYEKALLEQKTGWSDAEVLKRVRTRVTTYGADGIRIESQGAAPLEIPVVPPREIVDPTGVGDGFRSGSSARPRGV